MADQRVNIKVTTQGADKSKKQLGGLNTSIKSIGRSVLNASAAYFGATGLINGLMKSAELAGIQEQAEKKLAFSLGRTSTALLNQASALQKVSVFGDEATIAQMGFLASIGFTEEKIKEVIPVAMDLASATGMSLESAVRNTAKTFSGMAGELGELVPQIRNLTAEQMKAGDAVKVMGELFGGQAKAQAETYAGSVEQLKNDLGDMAESIGEIVIPVFEKLSPHIKMTIDFWKEYIGQSKRAKETNVEVSENMSVLNKQIDTQRERVELFTQASKDNNQIQEFAIANGVTFFEQKARALSTMDVEREKLATLIEQRLQLKQVEENGFGILAEGLEIRRQEIDLMGGITKVTAKYSDATSTLTKEKKEQLMTDLKSAALSGQSAMSAMKSVVRAETMEAVSGYISSVLKSTPYPLNLILAAGGGGLVAGLMDNALSSVKAETGFEGVVTKPTMFLTGENNKPEQVSVTPLGGGSASGVTINISAPLVDETVIDSIIPAIERAKKLGIA